jgi:hypothetical protein
MTRFHLAALMLGVLGSMAILASAQDPGFQFDPAPNAPPPRSIDQLRTFGEPMPQDRTEWAQKPETTVGRLATGTVFEDASRAVWMRVDPPSAAFFIRPGWPGADAGCPPYGIFDQPKPVAGCVYVARMPAGQLWLMKETEWARPVPHVEFRLVTIREQP